MAEPILWIPGLMADARLFLPQIVQMGAAHPMHIALATDADTVEQLSQNILACAPPSFILVGHGLGGDIALDILRRAPERVTRVVLMATEPLAEQPQIAAARESRIVAAKAGRLVEAMREEIPVHALADTEWRAEVLDLVQDMALGLGEGVFIRQTRALQRRPDQQKTMRRVKVPALILAGRMDGLVPLRRHEFNASFLPYGRLRIIEDAGYLPSLEQPDAVTDALLDFINGPVVLR